MKLKYLLPLFVIFSFVLAGCHDDDDSWWNKDSRKVTKIKINETIAEVGTRIPVDTYFTTHREFGTVKSLELVIKLDPELQYVTGSSNLYIEGKAHKRSPDRYIECDDGSTFLYYDLNHDEDLRDYTGSKDFNMRFDFIAAYPVKAARAMARAGKTVEFSCGSEFYYQKNDALRIE